MIMSTKATKILYWTINILFGGFMLFSSISTLMQKEQSVKFMHDMLGYPVYLISFISIMKILGVIALFVPGFPRMKEWAYAGLLFDLTGAAYSMVALGWPLEATWMMFLFILIGAAAYVTYRLKLNADGKSAL